MLGCTVTYDVAARAAKTAAVVVEVVVRVGLGTWQHGSAS